MYLSLEPVVVVVVKKDISDEIVIEGLLDDGMEIKEHPGLPIRQVVRTSMDERRTREEHADFGIRDR